MIFMNIPYAEYVIPNNWIGQYQMWENMQQDTSATDSSTVLQMFDTLAQGSRYAFLSNIEADISNGDFADATTLLNSGRDTIPDVDSDIATNVRLADNASSTFIVENYMTFYREYINYIQGTLANSDSLQIMALAQLCPEINGTVVYQARALYSFIYNDLSMFNDDSCVNADTVDIAERHSSPMINTQDKPGAKLIQQYTLLPNPNNGNMMLKQSISDEQPVVTEIWDAIGKNIFTQNIVFNSDNYNLQLGNISPGVYIMQLRDGKGNEFRFKFVVE